MTPDTNPIDRCAARFAVLVVESAAAGTRYADDHELLHRLERLIRFDLKHYVERLGLLLKALDTPR